MCVMSLVMEHYGDKWAKPPYCMDQRVFSNIPNQQDWSEWPPSQSQFSLKGKPVSDEEIAEFRALLERAREYDKRNNEPDCELESKKNRVKALAEELGIGDKLTFL